MELTPFAKLVILLQIVCGISAVPTTGVENAKNTTEIYWTHHITLPGGFQLKWFSTDETWLTMEMSAPTKGYLGIGFSPNGGMPGADIALGWVDDKGQPHLKDYYATKNGAPIEDPKQDFELLNAKEDASGTKIVFRRKWDTCDDAHDRKLGDDTVRLIWAWHADDPLEGKLHWHGSGIYRGAKSVYLKVLGKPRTFPDDKDKPMKEVLHWDIAMTNFTVPNATSYYHCKIFKFPKIDRKHHVIGYRPLIAADRVPYIHHINVLQCLVPEQFGSVDAMFGKYVEAGGHGQGCIDPTTPKTWVEYCFTFLIAHSIGAEGDIFPHHLGFPIGEETGNMYLRLEVHYENPQSLHMVDSSGLRIFYTPALRNHDIAMMFTGYRRTPFLSIPPHQKNFKISGYCPSECTQLGLPKGGIKIISVLLHAHLSGRKLTLRHVRNGTELPVIAQDHAYDFNYQEYRILPQEVVVLPGDELIMECDMGTEGRDQFVLGGLTSKNEMCEAFMYYYPTATLVDCRSQLELKSYLEPFGIQNVTGDLLKQFHLPYDPNTLPAAMKEFALIDDSFVMTGIDGSKSINEIFNTIKIADLPKELAGKKLLEYMTSLNWTDEGFTGKIEEQWRNGKRYAHCTAPKGKRIQLKENTFAVKKFQALRSEDSLRHCHHDHHPEAEPEGEPTAEPESEPKAEPESEPKSAPEAEPEGNPVSEPEAKGPAKPLKKTEEDKANSSSSTSKIFVNIFFVQILFLSCYNSRLF